MLEPHSIIEVFQEENLSGVAYKNQQLKRDIIGNIDISGNCTITDLASALNISVPKITNLVNELIEAGLVKDYGKIDSTGGRRASMYGLVAEACFFVGVDIKKYYINIGLLDFKKNLVTIQEKIPYTLANTVEAYNDLISIINNFIENAPVEKSKILSLGINLSGRVNYASGYSYSFFHFHEEPLSDTIEKDTGIKTFIENDSRAMGYGEFLCGAVNTEKNVLYLNMDYGIGLSMMIDGKIYYGKSGFSGEFGHIPVFNNEILCHCGKKGCLETEASGTALIKSFQEKIAAGTNSLLLTEKKNIDALQLYDVVQAALNEDILAIELIAAIGEKIGRGLAVLINILNPELIILGGPLAETGDYIRLPIKSAINKFSLSLVNNDTQLKTSKLGEKTGVLGACLMARNKLVTTI